MRITVNVDDELGAEIQDAAEKLEIKKSDWIRMACREFLQPSEPETAGGNKSKEAKPESAGKKAEELLKAREEELLDLKAEMKQQKELNETFGRLISEKDQRIDDLKESISRIEAMSITTTDQIASSKDERINDLNQMIEHLQAQAAAHSVAIQSAVRPALENGNSKKETETETKTEDGVDMIQKPKWMFWR